LLILCERDPKLAMLGIQHPIFENPSKGVPHPW
jgi:hypothetical protein